MKNHDLSFTLLAAIIITGVIIAFTSPAEDQEKNLTRDASDAVIATHNELLTADTSTPAAGS